MLSSLHGALTSCKRTPRACVLHTGCARPRPSREHRQPVCLCQRHAGGIQRGERGPLAHTHSSASHGCIRRLHASLIALCVGADATRQLVGADPHRHPHRALRQWRCWLQAAQICSIRLSRDGVRSRAPDPRVSESCICDALNMAIILVHRWSVQPLCNFLKLPLFIEMHLR